MWMKCPIRVPTRRHNRPPRPLKGTASLAPPRRTTYTLTPRSTPATEREMAQRENEEAELRVPETVTLCATCGFHGSAAGKNMCQSCLNSAARGGVSPPISCCGHEKPRSSPIRAAGRPEDVGKGVAGSEAEGEIVPAATVRGAPGRQVNRCKGCRRRVGLTTGFRCRCGELFCAEHRYTDRHLCSYDYKAAGREAIARENPVVRAAKIVRV